jgi:hypothetical protein
MTLWRGAISTPRSSSKLCAPMRAPRSERSAMGSPLLAVLLIERTTAVQDSNLAASVTEL